MTLVAAAVCPHPPLLVPSVGSGADHELCGLRSRARAAVAAVYAAAPDSVIVVGAGGGLEAVSLAPWGVDVAVEATGPLALPLLVGAWLTTGEQRSFVAVDPTATPAACAELGRELAGGPTRVGLVVMGDGSARLGEKAPGYLDDRAAGYDGHIGAALRAVDVDGLLALDVDLAAELLVVGRAAWQVLAGAAASSSCRCTSYHYEAPYGVGYHVARWVAGPVA